MTRSMKMMGRNDERRARRAVRVSHEAPRHLSIHLGRAALVARHLHRHHHHHCCCCRVALMFVVVRRLSFAPEKRLLDTREGVLAGPRGAASGVPREVEPQPGRFLVVAIIHSSKLGPADSPAPLSGPTIEQKEGASRRIRTLGAATPAANRTNSLHSPS
jgi:hypothetical protein